MSVREAHARFVLRTLQRFPAYTYRTLMAEDEALYTLLLIEQRGAGGDQ